MLFLSLSFSRTRSGRAKRTLSPYPPAPSFSLLFLSPSIHLSVLKKVRAYTVVNINVYESWEIRVLNDVSAGLFLFIFSFVSFRQKGGIRSFENVWHAINPRVPLGPSSIFRNFRFIYFFFFPFNLPNTFKLDDTLGRVRTVSNFIRVKTTFFLLSLCLLSSMPRHSLTFPSSSSWP